MTVRARLVGCTAGRGPLCTSAWRVWYITVQAVVAAAAGFAVGCDCLSVVLSMPWLRVLGLGGGGSRRCWDDLARLACLCLCVGPSTVSVCIGICFKGACCWLAHCWHMTPGVLSSHW